MRKDIQEAIQDSNGLFFPIPLLVRIFMTSFLAFILFFCVQKHSCLYNEKKVTRRLKIQILFSCVRKQYFYLLAVLFHKLLFLPLENKTHIFTLVSLRSFVKYCFYHSKIKLIYSRWRYCGDIHYIFYFVSCHGSSLKQSLVSRKEWYAELTGHVAMTIFRFCIHL